MMIIRALHLAAAWLRDRLQRLLALGLAGCGYFFSNLAEQGWLAHWSSTFVPLSLVLSAAAFADALSASSV